MPVKEPYKKPNERLQLQATKKLTPKERLLGAIRRARFDARLAMIRLKNNKSRYLRNTAIAATAAGVIGVGIGVGEILNSQIQKPRVETVERNSRVNYVPKQQTRNTIYTSKQQKPKPIVDAKKSERESKYLQQEKARLEQINKSEDFVGSFLEDPVQGVKKIKSIKNKGLREQYAHWVLTKSATIENFERVYNTCKDKEFQKELIKSFGDFFTMSVDGGALRPYNLQEIFEIKNVNLRQSVFERILSGSREGSSSTVLNTLHHQYEYDALLSFAKTLPNSKKYILDLQKQKKSKGRNWEY